MRSILTICIVFVFLGAVAHSPNSPLGENINKQYLEHLVKKGVDEVIDILQPEAFYREAHQHIFSAMVKLFENSEPIDLLTVSAQLKKDQACFSDQK